MAKFEVLVKGNFNLFSDALNQSILNSAVSMNLVDETIHEFEETKVILRVYDKYYMRNNSRASLSVTLVGRGDEILVTAIGAGGGNGLLINFSLGAERDMIDVVERFVNSDRDSYTYL